MSGLNIELDEPLETILTSSLELDEELMVKLEGSPTYVELMMIYPPVLLTRIERMYVVLLSTKGMRRK